MASLHKRNDVSYVAIDIDGKPEYRSKRTTRKSEALETRAAKVKPLKRAVLASRP